MVFDKYRVIYCNRTSYLERTQHKSQKDACSEKKVVWLPERHNYNYKMN